MANNYGAKNPQKFRRTDVTFHLDACCVFKEKKKGPKRSDFTKVTSSIISFIHSFISSTNIYGTLPKMCPWETVMK